MSEKMVAEAPMPKASIKITERVNQRACINRRIAWRSSFRNEVNGGSLPSAARLPQRTNEHHRTCSEYSFDPEISGDGGPEGLQNWYYQPGQNVGDDGSCMSQPMRRCRAAVAMLLVFASAVVSAQQATVKRQKIGL